MKITVNTITDEQIRELRAHLGSVTYGGSSDDATDCHVALAAPVGSLRRRLARARCAEILSVAFASASDDDVAKVWRLGAAEGVHGNPDVMHLATVARNAQGDFSLIEQAFARAGCVEILKAHTIAKCPGRGQHSHTTASCNGTCCTNCGGPIDENEECRC